MPDEPNETPATNDGEQTGENNTQGQNTATSAGNEGNNQTQSQSTGRTFTQEDVNGFVGTARQEARDRAVNSLLEELGLKDVDSLKGVVKDYNDQRQAQLSDLERANEELERLTPFESQAKSHKKQLDAYEAAMKANVEGLMEKLEVPEHVAPLLENMTLLERFNYLSEHGEKFAKPSGNNAPNTNASSKGGGNSKQLNEEERQKRIRQRYNIL